MTQPSQQVSLYAAQQQQQQPQHPSSLDPSREIQELINAYNPNHPDYRFRAYFYNVVKDPRLRVKPQNVSERKWRELLDAVGGENNPQYLWPVQYDGFDGLLRRKREAEAEIKAQNEFIEAALSSMRQITQWCATELEKRMQGIKNKSMEQQHRLIKAFRLLHRAETKMYADANGGAIPPMSPEEIQLLNDFKALSSKVNRSAASLPRRAEALAAAARLQHPIAPADEVQLTDDQKMKIMAVIKRQSAQIEALERQIDEKVKAGRAAEKKSDGEPSPPPRSSSSLLFTQSMLRRRDDITH